MSILSRWSRKSVERAKVAELPRDCGHWELAPRWDAAAVHPSTRDLRSRSLSVVNVEKGLPMNVRWAAVGGRVVAAGFVTVAGLLAAAHVAGSPGILLLAGIVGHII